MIDSSPSSKPSIPTDAAFDALIARAQACHACPAMDGRIRVLSRANGPPTTQVMLVGEAPGRRGAGRTGVPFDGDRSGDRLDQLPAAAGWRRASVFLTNAVLCNPLSARGTNRPPTRTEITACSTWLSRQILVVDPLLVVALGAVALRALQFVSPHDQTLADSASEPARWHDRYLAAAYHPSARSQVHRSFDLQREDFAELGRWLAAQSISVSAR